jgi:hypothetical protein
MQAHEGQLKRAILFVHSELIIMDDEVCLGTHG